MTTALASCLPFRGALQGDDCCTGAEHGRPCVEDADCLGLMKCTDGRCSGSSGCEPFCERNNPAGGPPLNCCMLEPPVCSTDEDCTGARTCVGRRCAGESGCEARRSGAEELKQRGFRIVYDEECLCLPGSPCLYPRGVPCAAQCDLEHRGATNFCHART